MTQLTRRRSTGHRRLQRRNATVQSPEHQCRNEPAHRCNRRVQAVTGEEPGARGRSVQAVGAARCALLVVTATTPPPLLTPPSMIISSIEHRSSPTWWLSVARGTEATARQAAGKATGSRRGHGGVEQTFATAPDHLDRSTVADQAPRALRSEVGVADAPTPCRTSWRRAFSWKAIPTEMARAPSQG